ncbi:MAG TPA: hypothetical protein VL240_12285 [Candidatus Binatia bacterium]|nr:hypothetical protein [Candidatus Binatia bacterium]
MHGKAHSHNSLFGMNWNPANAALALLLTLLFLIFLLLFLFITAQPAQGQTYQSFTATSVAPMTRNPQVWPWMQPTPSMAVGCLRL